MVSLCILIIFFFLVLLGCVLSELMKYLYIARHLAAKTRTNFAVFDLISFLIMDGYILEWCIFSVDLGKRYFHQV